MKQSVFTSIKESSKNVLYPIYESDIVCDEITGVLGDEVNRVLDRSFGKITTIFTLGKYPFQAIHFLGMGNKEEMTSMKMRKVIADTAKELKKPIGFAADKAVTENINIHQIAGIFAESYLLASYKEQIIGHEAEGALDMEVFASEENVQEDIDRAKAYAKGINYARKLSDTPANLMTPENLAKEAEKLAEKYGMECTILDKAALEEMGAGGILAVNRGSDVPACMICLKYNGCEGPYKAVVGKGLTFDSGGYNIKSNSLGMKYDMCGGADVLGIMQILAATKANTNVYGIIPSTENLISEKAYRPQDVIKTLSGKTVEIISTDAEGRLILCDALTYAQTFKVTHMIDLATLTGACVRALGTTYTGVFANDDEFYKEFETAMAESDEKGWRLPLDQEYFEQLKSSSADFKNSSGKAFGGACVAASFLNAFVNDDVKWIHLDIAGTADNDGKAATGAMIRSVVNVLK